MAFKGSLCLIGSHGIGASSVKVVFIEMFIVSPNIIVFSQTECRLQQTILIKAAYLLRLKRWSFNEVFKRKWLLSKDFGFHLSHFLQFCLGCN
jgi:hypothetical protein